jgi:hypothetical protein
MAYKKTVQFEGKYGHKKFGKDKFYSLGHNKLVLRSKTFFAT